MKKSLSILLFILCALPELSFAFDADFDPDITPIEVPETPDNLLIPDWVPPSDYCNNDSINEPPDAHFDCEDFVRAYCAKYRQYNPEANCEHLIIIYCRVPNGDCEPGGEDRGGHSVAIITLKDANGRTMYCAIETQGSGTVLACAYSRAELVRIIAAIKGYHRVIKFYTKPRYWRDPNDPNGGMPIPGKRLCEKRLHPDYAPGDSLECVHPEIIDDEEPEENEDQGEGEVSDY